MNITEKPAFKFNTITFTVRGEELLVPGLPTKGVDAPAVDVGSRTVSHLAAARSVGKPDRTKLDRLRPDCWDTGDLKMNGEGPCRGILVLLHDRLDRGYILSGVTQELKEAAKPAIHNRRAKKAQYRIVLSFQNPQHPEFAGAQEFRFTDAAADAVNRLLEGTWAQGFVYDNRPGGTPSATYNFAGFMWDEKARYEFIEVEGGEVKLQTCDEEESAGEEAEQPASASA